MVLNKFTSPKKGASIPPDCQQGIIHRLWAWESASRLNMRCEIVEKIPHGTRNLGEANNVEMFNMSLR